MSVQGLTLARWFIGTALLSGIGVAAMLLYRLFGRWIALHRCGMFLSFSPLFLAQSRRVHTDALAATFVLLTVLSLLLYCDTIPKTPLPCRFWNRLWSSLPCQKQLPYSSLVGAYLLRPVSESRGNVVAVLSSRGLGAGLCFLSCTLLIVFALLPLFWTPICSDIWDVCLLGVTLFAYRELQKGERQRLTLYLASVVVVGVVFWLYGPEPFGGCSMALRGRLLRRITSNTFS